MMKRFRKMKKAVVGFLIMALLLGVFSPGNYVMADPTNGADAGAFVHCSISTENEIVSHGQYTSFTVRYQMDYKKVNEDDYLVVRVPDNLKRVDFQADPLHFKACELQQDGTYHLIFNENAPNGLTGSFSINATAVNESASAVTATVYAGEASKSITIAGQNSGQGGQRKPINKSAYDGDIVEFGGYDTSTGEGDDATEIGIYKPSEDRIVTFTIFVNDSDPEHPGRNMTNVTVIDDIPEFDGVTYNHDAHVADLNGAEYTDNSKGTHLEYIFSSLSPDQSPRIVYSVTIEAGTTLKINNNASLTFDTAEGVTETLVDRYQLRPGGGYSASIARKSVDKTEVTDLPEDQIVTYTITFVLDEEHATGTINLKDELNENVRFVRTYGDSAIDVEYDETVHTVYMVNNQTIDGSKVRSVILVTDFSNVPVDTDVTNTVGNTVHTRKYKAPDRGSLTFTKTVNGPVTEEDLKEISFTVKNEDTGVTVGTYSLADIKNTDGSYSKTLENLPVGQYSVKEANEKIEGYSVTVDYSVKDGKVTVSEGETAIVEITDTYTEEPEESESPEESSSPAESESPEESRSQEESSSPAESESQEESSSPAESESQEESSSPVESKSQEESSSPVESESSEESSEMTESGTSEESRKPAEDETTEENKNPKGGNKPDKTTPQKNAPKTGDENHMILWMILLFVSGLAVVAAWKLFFNENREKKD